MFSIFTIVWKEKLLQYICVLAYDVHIKCV